MKSKKSKLYIYFDLDGNETVFKAYTKKDIRKYLGITQYKIDLYCWEETSFNINVYWKDSKIIDLTN